MWNRESAILLCELLEPIAEKCGAHVALTGGCLYKEGKRKDVDIMFYRHKCNVPINLKKLEKLMRKEEILWSNNKSGRVHKAQFKSTWIDMFFPMEPEYNEKDYLNSNEV